MGCSSSHITPISAAAVSAVDDAVGPAEWVDGDDSDDCGTPMHPTAGQWAHRHSRYSTASMESSGSNQTSDSTVSPSSLKCRMEEPPSPTMEALLFGEPAESRLLRRKTLTFKLRRSRADSYCCPSPRRHSLGANSARRTMPLPDGAARLAKAPGSGARVFPATVAPARIPPGCRPVRAVP
eukprot:EG_transcript_22881